MKKVKILFILAVCALLAGCAAPAADTGGRDYGCIRGELSALTPEAAGAYLAVVDELAGRLGFEEAEAAPGECLYGGFVRDWDGDGTPELCLVMKTSPRDADGTPLYGGSPLPWPSTPSGTAGPCPQASGICTSPPAAGRPWRPSCPRATACGTSYGTAAPRRRRA